MTDSPLLQPMTFPCGAIAPNRVWLAPMTNKQSHADGTLSDDELHWLVARAEGGFGVIESCATHVSEDGQGWDGEWGIFADRHIDGWRRAADAVHAHGALLIAQLFHGGERALRRGDAPPWSATALHEPGHEKHARAATPDDIRRVIDAFVASAHRAVKAGLDGIELHGAHGYLLCQFLRADRNTRDDAWGGSLENRARLLRTILRRTRAEVPESFIVGVRLSPEDGGHLTGLDLDESLQTAKWLAEDGADFVHVSLWDATPNTKKRPDLHAATAFRHVVPGDVPIITAGNIWSRADGEHQRTLGADAVALGRAGICNPDWPQRVLVDGLEPARPPLTAQQLRDRALSERFVDYMRRWDGFVA